MISRFPNVDVLLVLIVFYEMRVCLAYLFNEFFKETKGNKHTWAKPMGSTEWKSVYDIDHSFSMLIIVCFVLKQKYKKL